MNANILIFFLCRFCNLRMATKRSHIDIDPDYEDVTKAQTKRQKVLEEDGKHIALHFFDIHQNIFQYDCIEKKIVAVSSRIFFQMYF